MSNAQDPSAPPSPYQPPAAPGPDWNALAPPINTPGLPVPGIDPASIGPPAPPAQPVAAQPTPAPESSPDIGVPPALALNAPVVPDQRETIDVSSKAPQALPPASDYARMGIPGGNAVDEARRRAQLDSQENQQLAKQYDTAITQEKMAQAAASEVEKNQARVLATNISEQQAQLAEIKAKSAASQSAYDQTIAQKQADWDKAVEAQNNLVFDPDKYVNSMSLGSKIFTAIAVGLSAFGSSRSIGGSGENMALKMLNDSIQHNVDAQKEQYRRLGNRVDAASNAYARARQIRMDDYQATLAAKQSVIDEHAMAVKVITARYEPERIDAHRQLLTAQLDKMSVQAKQEYAKTTHAEASRAASDVLQARQAGFNMALGAANYNLAAQSEADRHQGQLAELAMKQQIADQKADKKPGSILGWNGVAPTQEQQNKAAEAVGTYETLAPLMQKLSDFRKQHSGGETADRGAVAESKSMHKTVLTEVKNLAGLGVLTGSDVEIVTEMIGPPPDSHSISDVAYQATIQQALKYVEKKTQAKMRAYGYTPTPDANPLTRKADPMTADPGFREAEGGK